MNFEKVKKQLIKLENPTPSSLIAGIAATVPFFGGLFSEGIHLSVNNFQAKKRTQFLDIILADSKSITSEMVNDIEFIINFAKTLEAVNRLTTNDKIVYFATLIKKGYFTSEPIINDEFEEYLNLLNELSYRELYILFNYVNHSKDKLKTNIKENEMLKLFYSVTTQELDISDNEIMCILERLQNKQLCIFSEGFETGEYWCTTAYYDKFAKRVSLQTTQNNK